MSLRRPTLALAVLAAAGTAAVAAAPAGAEGPTATAAATCKPGKYPGDGYFTSLQVTRVSCTTGRKVAGAHYRCRVRNGGRKGYCRSRVLGYRCTESKRQSIPTEFNARVTCVDGRKKVVFTYQQNT